MNLDTVIINCNIRNTRMSQIKAAKSFSRMRDARWSLTTLIFLLISCRTDANDGEVHIGGKLLDADTQDSQRSASLEAQAAQHSSGSFSTFKHSASSAAAGQQIFVARSANWGQSRAHASKIVELNPTRKSVDNIALSRTADRIVQNDIKHRSDLHYAFRLPLQRLSDRQLTTLLDRYQSRHKTADKLDYNTMSRAEKLMRLQKLIVTSSGASGGRLQLIRPTLLTNINVINEDHVNSFAIKKDNESDGYSSASPPTTEKIVQQSEGQNLQNASADSKHLSSLIGSRLDGEDEALAAVGKTSESVDQLTRLLNEFRARYEHIKQLFQKKLEELNEKRKLIMAKLRGDELTSDTESNSPVQFTTTVSTVSEISSTEATNIISSVGPNDDFRNPLKFASLDSVSQSPAIDSTTENDSERRTYPSELITVKFASKPTTTTVSSTSVDNDTITITNPSTVVETSTTHVDEEQLVVVVTTALSEQFTVATITSDKADSSTVFVTEMNPIMEKDSKLATTEITTIEHSDPFSPASSNEESVRSGESKLLKKILGLIQFVKNNRTRPTALLSTGGGTFSTSQIIASHNDDGNDNSERKNDEEIMVPRAEATPKKSQLISNDDDQNERNEHRPEKIGDDSISTIELMKKLKAENEQYNRRREWKKQDVPTTGNVDDITGKNNDPVNICAAINCDFEQGTLCSWTASEDTVPPGDRQYRIRRVRETNGDKSKFVRRTWHNWEGRYRNRLTGIARADIFSSVNRRFAAAYTKPRQYATLTAEVPSGGDYTIKFHAWEATRDLRLRLCCESFGEQNCVFETEPGVRRGSRHWKEHHATCLAGTTKIIFECLNDGIYQGACGVDNIQLDSSDCPLASVSNRIVENRR